MSTNQFEALHALFQPAIDVATRCITLRFGYGHGVFDACGKEKRRKVDPGQYELLATPIPAIPATLLAWCAKYAPHLTGMLTEDTILKVIIPEAARRAGGRVGPVGVEHIPATEDRKAWSRPSLLVYRGAGNAVSDDFLDALMNGSAEEAEDEDEEDQSSVPF